MPHFAVLLNASAELAASFTVHADHVSEDASAGVLRFVRDERVVHQVPMAWVASVAAFAHALSAREAVAAHRAAQVGGATIHVQESAAAAPRGRRGVGGGTAVPAEGIAFRVEEGRR